MGTTPSTTIPKYDLWGHTGLDIEIPEDVFPDEAWRAEQDAFLDHPDHGYFESTHEGKKLHYQTKLPPKGTKVRAIVVFQHGIAVHAGLGCKVPSDGRYTEMGLRFRALVAKGYAVYTVDTLGHGYSEGERFYIPNGDWTINRSDLLKFVKLAASQHPQGTPLFLAGESYGGCLAFHASHNLWNSDDRPVGFMGCVLDCPALEGDIPPWPVKAMLMYVLKPMAPKWTPFFMPNPVSPERIWKDSEVRDIMTDPETVKGLSRGGVPFSLGTATALVLAIEESRKLRKDFAVPFHISHGTDDAGVPITGSQQLFEESQTPEADKELNKIPGGYHALLAEIDAASTLQHAIDWMEKRILQNAAEK